MSYRQIAELDLAVLGMYFGWSRNGKTPAQAVAEIKTKSSKILLANYTIMTEVTSNTSDTDTDTATATATAYMRTKLGAEKYRRRFEHGMAIVNRKGNGAQTVTVEAGYSRFLGKQAPSVNNGQPVTTLTLADRDGILLVKP